MSLLELFLLGLGAIGIVAVASIALFFFVLLPLFRLLDLIGNAVLGKSRERSREA